MNSYQQSQVPNQQGTLSSPTSFFQVNFDHFNAQNKEVISYNYMVKVVKVKKSAETFEAAIVLNNNKKISSAHVEEDLSFFVAKTQ